MPIPVAGPFDRVGVDIVQLPKSSKGNQYAIVFVDYLTKWPEVYPAKDQTAITIARHFVQDFIPRHGVPRQLLSDRGPALLSKILSEVYELMGTRKVNTTAYHPQTDGLVERFNRMLTDMLSKSADQSGRDWDTRLPYVLFAYRASVQESTQESPFFLMYGRDPQLPTEAVLHPEPDRFTVSADDYRSEFVSGISRAWTLAQQSVKKAQNRQKLQHDRHAKDPQFQVGARVFVYMPAAKSGKAYKLARAFHGPYRVVEVVENGLLVRPIDKPRDTPIRVALNRVRCCPKQIPDEFWPTRRQSDKDKSSLLTAEKDSNSKKGPELPNGCDSEPADNSEPGSWAGRLRTRPRTS